MFLLVVKFANFRNSDVSSKIVICVIMFVCFQCFISRNVIVARIPFLHCGERANRASIVSDNKWSGCTDFLLICLELRALVFS